MKIYTVHAPASYGVDVRTAADRLVFVRDGFYFWAFAVTIVWMIWHRLWLALVGYLVLTFAVEALLRATGAGYGVHFVVMLVIALLVGFEASSLRRWKLSRGKWRQLDIVAARDEEEAENRFFARWNGRSASSDYRASAPPPLPHASLAQPRGIIGLFPEPGASR